MADPTTKATPKPTGKVSAIPATETAAIISMLAKLKITPPRNANSHCRLPAFMKSSRKLKPSKPRLPAVKARIRATASKPRAKSKQKSSKRHLPASLQKLAQEPKQTRLRIIKNIKVVGL